MAIKWFFRPRCITSDRSRSVNARAIAPILISLIVITLMRTGEAKPPAPSAKEPTAAEERYIPGLFAVDVHANFTKKGYKLIKESGSDYAMWRCVEDTPKYTRDVQTIGPSATRITRVRAVHVVNTQEDPDRSSEDFLGFVATLTYDGSKPAEAKSWVIKNIGKSVSTTFGGMTFELIANPDAPRARILLIYPPIGDEAAGNQQAAPSAKGTTAKTAGNLSLAQLRAKVIAAGDKARALMDKEGLTDTEKLCVHEYVGHNKIESTAERTPRVDQIIASEEVRDWVKWESIYIWENEKLAKKK